MQSMPEGGSRSEVTTFLSSISFRPNRANSEKVSCSSSPINKLRIIAHSSLFDPKVSDKLKHIIETFFKLSPDQKTAETLLKGLAYKPWEQSSPNYDKEWDAKVADLWAKAEAEHKKNNTDLPKAYLPVSRSSSLPVVPPLMRIKYNVVNNKRLAAALGTRNKDTPLDEYNGGPDTVNNPELKIEPHMWPMWQSASRSCITRCVPM